MKATGPETKEKVLLHLCCAPDGTVPWPDLLAEGYAVEGFFYGNNIHPEEEFLRRLDAARILASSLGCPLHVLSYDPQSWIETTRRLAREPEGGARCLLCFRLQLEAAGDLAGSLGFSLLATTLTISPHKDVTAVNAVGREVAARRGLVWLDRIWRKGGGFVRSVAESRRLALYRQKYCGCLYSLRGDEDREKKP